MFFELKAFRFASVSPSRTQYSKTLEKLTSKALTPQCIIVKGNFLSDQYPITPRYESSLNIQMHLQLTHLLIVKICF